MRCSPRATRARAAEAETLAARIAWIQGRGDDVLQHVERAEELAEPLPTSAAKAGVYARPGAASLARQHERASSRRLVDQALEMADELGLPAIRAPLLSMVGTMRATEGDLEGLDALEESIALYEELGSPDAQRPYNNLADTLYRLGRIHDAADATARMSAARQRFPGIVEWARWNDSQELRIDYATGRWEQALELADREIAELEAGTRHYLEPDWRIFRARIRFARGDTAGAEEDAATAVDASARLRRRAARGPQPRASRPGCSRRAAVPRRRASRSSCSTPTAAGPLDTVSDWFPEAASGVRRARSALQSRGDRRHGSRADAVARRRARARPRGPGRGRGDLRRDGRAALRGRGALAGRSSGSRCRAGRCDRVLPPRRGDGVPRRGGGAGSLRPAAPEGDGLAPSPVRHAAVDHRPRVDALRGEHAGGDRRPAGRSSRS